MRRDEELLRTGKKKKTRKEEENSLNNSKQYSTSDGTSAGFNTNLRKDLRQRSNTEAR